MPNDAVKIAWIGSLLREEALRLYQTQKKPTLGKNSKRPSKNVSSKRQNAKRMKLR